MNQFQLKNYQYDIVIILSAILLPFFLIPIVALFGYSEMFEEFSKFLVIFFLILKLSSFKLKIYFGIIFGFLFGLSECLFYLNNIFQLGDFSILWQRILWTVSMHIITVLVMIFAGLVGKKWIVLGLGGSLALHFIFNNILVRMF